MSRPPYPLLDDATVSCCLARFLTVCLLSLFTSVQLRSVWLTRDGSDEILEEDLLNKNKSSFVKGSIMSTGQYPESALAAFWLDEVVYYDTSGSEAEEAKAWLVSHSDSDSDTSDAGSSGEETESTNISESENKTLLSQLGCIYGRNKYKWFKKAPSRAARAREPTNQRKPCANLTENEGDFMSIWKKLFDDEILQKILRWTNVKLTKSRAAATENKDDLHDLDMAELLSFIGVLVFSALFRSNDADGDFIFATDGTGRDIFKCIMSKDRFVNLLKCIRFDNSSDKEARRTNNKLAAISNIFQIFVNNCQNLYNPGQYVTVDELLIPFKEPSCLTFHRRRCDKLSFQIMCLCDAETGYFCNGYIYKGDDSDSEGMTEDEKSYSVPTRSVLRLTRRLHGTDRNVTCSKCFTSIELIDSLKKYGLSCICAVKKSMKELPLSFLPAKSRAVGSTLYAFTNEMTLASHVPSRKKAVIVASSMHHDADKSEIIRCYESTKDGVVKIDKKRGLYSCARYTRRASLAIFYWLLDISLNNTLIAYEVYHDRKFKRDEFLLDLARSLVLQQLQRRVYETQLPLNLRRVMTRFLGPEMPSAPDDHVVPKARRTCYTCPPKLKRKSSYQCYVCKKHVCLECARQVCRDCAL